MRETGYWVPEKSKIKEFTVRNYDHIMKHYKEGGYQSTCKYVLHFL